MDIEIEGRGYTCFGAAGKPYFWLYSGDHTAPRISE